MPASVRAVFTNEAVRDNFRALELVPGPRQAPTREARNGPFSPSHCEIQILRLGKKGE
jgi:hypothetical protein